MTGLNLMDKTLAAVRGARLSSFKILDVVELMNAGLQKTAGPPTTSQNTLAFCFMPDLTGWCMPNHHIFGLQK